MGIADPIIKILMNEWDPIGVKDSKEAEGEYDTYAMQLLGMLYRSESEEKIVSFLNECLDYMGLPHNQILNSAVAKKLLALDLPKSIDKKLN